MVSSASIYYMVFSLIIAIGLPIFLAVYFYTKRQISLKAVGIGALVFFIAQIMIRTPLLSMLGGMEWYQQLSENALGISVFLGLTAGIFEELGRYIGFQMLLKDELEWKNGVAYGIGHGGLEAIILVGFAYISNLAFSLMINRGTYDVILNAAGGQQAAEVVKNQLINTASVTFAAAGIERIFAIIIQIALSLVVLYAVMHRKQIYLLWAILLHTLVNVPVGYMVMTGHSIWYAEAVMVAMALVALIWIIKSKEVLGNRNGLFINRLGKF